MTIITIKKKIIIVIAILPLFVKIFLKLKAVLMHFNIIKLELSIVLMKLFFNSFSSMSPEFDSTEVLFILQSHWTVLYVLLYNLKLHPDWHKEIFPAWA